MYEGQWREQMLHGMGSYTWTDGKKYMGEYRSDKKEGYDNYTLQDTR